MQAHTTILAAYLTLFATPVFAADLNAPINDRPTIGSELLRGYHAALNCDQPPESSSTYSKCILDASSGNEQRQANFLPFETGLFWGATENFQNELESDTSLANSNKFASDSIAGDTENAAEMYRVFHTDQRKLGLSDGQLIDAMTDYNTLGRTRSMTWLKAWEANPPTPKD